MTTETPLDVLATVVTSEAPRASMESATVTESKKRPAEEIVDESSVDKKQRSSSDSSSSSSGSPTPVSEDAPIKSPPPQMVADQLRASLKLREQQKALIEARRGSLSATPPGTPKKNPQLSIWTTSSPSEHVAAPSGPNGAQSARLPSLMSPRQELGARELPPPSMMSQHYGPRSALPSMSRPAFSPVPASTRGNGSAPMSRLDFMRFFEHMYDQNEHAHHLVANLNDQVRHSASLLQTLQASGSMIEGLVRGHFREMQASMGEKFGLALTDLNRRIKVIEERLGIERPSESPSLLSPIFPRKENSRDAIPEPVPTQKAVESEKEEVHA